MRILLIEDDPTTSRSIELMLARANLSVATTDLGETGLSLALRQDYDVILLDLGLPDIDGLEVLRQMRSAHISAPILVLTGSDDRDLMLDSFEEGATDVLPKPFHREALVTLVRTVARRREELGRDVVRAGPIEVDLNVHAVTVEGQPVALTPREYQILELLARRKGSTLTKEMFLDHLYAEVPDQAARIIDVLICKLRKKLVQAGAEGCIYTVWGRGYVLQDPSRVEAFALAS